jgi:hypothetical protein
VIDTRHDDAVSGIEAMGSIIEDQVDVTADDCIEIDGVSVMTSIIAGWQLDAQQTRHSWRNSEISVGPPTRRSWRRDTGRLVDGPDARTRNVPGFEGTFFYDT